MHTSQCVDGSIGGVFCYSQVPDAINYVVGLVSKGFYRRALTASGICPMQCTSVTGLVAAVNPALAGIVAGVDVTIAVAESLTYAQGAALGRMEPVPFIAGNSGPSAICFDPAVKLGVQPSQSMPSPTVSGHSNLTQKPSNAVRAPARLNNFSRTL